MTGTSEVADGGDESLRRALARLLGGRQREERTAERFLLADPDDDAVHVIEFGRADRPDHVETIDAGDVDPSESDDAEPSGFDGVGPSGFDGVGPSAVDRHRERNRADDGGT